MAETNKNNPDDLWLRKRRASTIVVTRSPVIRGEIPEENIAEADVADRERKGHSAELEEFGKPDQPA